MHNQSNEIKKLKLNDNSNINMHIQSNEIKKLKLNDNSNINIHNQSNEIKKLKDELNKYRKENEELKLKLDISHKENNKLKEDLIKANKIISNIQNNNETKNLKDEINKLKYELNMKENEIKDLNNKIKNSIQKEMKVDYNDIMVINFVSGDFSVNCGIKCLPTDIFAEVEEKLYKRFNNLRNTNNMFMANAKPILRFKKICENNIQDGDVLQLHKLE